MIIRQQELYEPNMWLHVVKDHILRITQCLLIETLSRDASAPREQI